MITIGIPRNTEPIAAQGISGKKLGSLTDVVYTKALVEEIVRLHEEATRAARAAELTVQSPSA